MDKLFGKKDVKGDFFKWFVCTIHFNYLLNLITEEIKEQNKVLRGAQRDIERDRNQLDREKKRLVS